MGGVQGNTMKTNFCKSELSNVALVRNDLQVISNMRGFDSPTYPALNKQRGVTERNNPRLQPYNKERLSGVNNK